jgi:pyruvate,water dikinase
MFQEVGLEDSREVGGKNAALGELTRQLRHLDLLVPDGFAVTTDGYESFIGTGQARTSLSKVLNSLDTRSFSNLLFIAEKARRIVLECELPADLVGEIFQAYESLMHLHGSTIQVAVRSSAVEEDLTEASFAGRYDSFLNIRSKEELLLAIRKVYASLFNARAIKYRVQHGFTLENAQLSVGVQVMVRADLACSGVCFTVDPDSGFREVVVINGTWGLGENVVQGRVDPDEFHVFKTSLIAHKQAIIRRRMGTKALTMGYASNGMGVENRATPPSLRDSWILTDEEVLLLARWCVRIEQHFGKAMDIEWAKDGITGKLHILQARAETVHSKKNTSVLKEYTVTKDAPAICEGQAVGVGIVAGRARILHSLSEAYRFNEGDVLIADYTNPDWDGVLKKASAIITNHGGRTSHAAIVARETGAIAVVGARDAMRLIRDGEFVTVNCTEGKIGKVHKGVMEWKVKEHPLDKVASTHTKPMLIMANPDQAYDNSFYPCDGVGLMRLEFLMSRELKIHPMALAAFERVYHASDIMRINEITRGYKDKQTYFVDRMSQGIATIAAAFYPKPVIVRFSDFKSNEYASLIGGKTFEKDEENPMIGFRGAARYYNENYEPAFVLECKTIRYVRNTQGLTNVRVMIPFCRTVKELDKVLEIMSQNGLERGVMGLEVYMMVEVPSNVIQAEDFADRVDGFSIGTNDLTQLTLGIDRDSEQIADLYDESNTAVEWMIQRTISAAHNAGIKVGLCGQAPSDSAAFASYLVHLGIDTISFTQDAFMRGIQSIHQAESKIKSKHLIEI